MNEKNFREKYYSKAKEQTFETLPKFLNEMFQCGFDYGSICCAVAASALAAANAANHHKKAGITGFQAGAVMWEFIQQWNYPSNKCGLRIIDYDNMLYSQYNDKFEKTISKSTFEALQKQAQKLLDEDKASLQKYDKDLDQYEKDLAKFVKQYPDYHDRPKHYKRLGCGTGVEWDAEKKKEESGFEFAPDEPYYHAGQLIHWQSMVDGVIPFGYAISEDQGAKAYIKGTLQTAII